MPHARVILATYNQVPFLKLSLRGYLRQTTQNFSLVLADDGSGEEQVRFVREFAPLLEERGIQVEHVWQEDRGWRKNRVMNEAARRTRDESLLIFSDADCIPPARFVERHIEAHEPGSFQVAGAYRLSREVSETLTEADVDSGRYERLGTPDDWARLSARARKSRWGTLVRRKYRPRVIGLNMAVDLRLFQAVNGFDEVFEWPYFGEDSDLRDRLMRLRPRPRVKVLYTLNDVYHLWHPSKNVKRNDNRAYYNTRRPIRCALGMVSDSSGEPRDTCRLGGSR